MKFAIQASNPRTTCSVNESDTTLCEAIQSIFPLHAEFAILVWNDLYVPLSYKYDVSVIIDDILTMLTALIGEEEGSISIHWPSSTFRVHWMIEWSADKVNINSHWECVIGGTESLLNKVPRLTIEKQCFLAEWSSLLSNISILIRVCANSIELGIDMSLLDAVLKSITSTGCLYKD